MRTGLALLFWPGLLAAQELGTLTGTVTAADKTPVAQARVTVVGTALVAVTRVDGGFHVAGVAPGAQTLDVRMLGYKPTLLPVEVEAGESLHVQVILAVEPVPLPAVHVTAERAVRPELRGFEERRARGAGLFFTREDIARMQSRLFTDVLRRVPGIQIQPVAGAFGTGYVVQLARSTGIMGNRSCPVLFYVNGAPFPITGDQAINHFIAPDDVVGVEVYAAISRIPAQFSSSMHNARCGVIAIWTYGGERRQASPR